MRSFQSTGSTSNDGLLSETSVTVSFLSGVVPTLRSLTDEGDVIGSLASRLFRDFTYCLVLVGNGGMDPYTRPYIIPKNSPQYPFPHSLLSTSMVCPFGEPTWRFFVMDPTPGGLIGWEVRLCAYEL